MSGTSEVISNMAASTNSAMEAFNALREKKEANESEMKELMQVLETQGVGMDGTLVDEQDFPRADIDIYSVRHARHRVKVLQNDHKILMKQIEEQLYTIHAEARERKLNDGIKDAKLEPAKDVASDQLVAFAKVDRVDGGSPASQAGLAIGDEIVQFGSITSTNFVNLQTIGSVVQHSKGVSVEVVVIRDGSQVRLSLTPQTWSGRGLLGCNIVPIAKG